MVQTGGAARGDRGLQQRRELEARRTVLRAGYVADDVPPVCTIAAPGPTSVLRSVWPNSMRSSRANCSP